MTTELHRRFDDPPRAFSPVPIWWWSGDPLDPERLRWQLERFAEGGIFNLVVMNLAPTSPMFGSDADDPPFFSEAWWAIFRGVCEDAGRLGISIWFYDQIGFSGANLQAEIVKESPEFAGRWLQRTATEMSEAGELACPAGGEPIFAAALPIDGDGAPTGKPIPLPVQDGKVSWDGSGPHRVMLFYSVERGFDYHSPAACRTLIEAVHGAYEARVGDHFGSTIVGSFQDELPSMPTWSEDFAEQFEKRRGYDLMPHLAALWEEYDDDAKRVRRDFHATRAAISEETFFKPLFHWHEERGLTCGFDQQDPARAGYPVESVDRYADYQRTHRWYGAPGSDHHGDAKIHSSLAHLYDRPRTWIEAFHSSGWGGTLEETFDWLLPWLRAGANLYDPHAVYYSTRGGWWEWAPPSTDWRQPYWEHYHRFSRTVSRLCSVLTLGHHVCDVGLLFPTATVQAGLRLDGTEGYAKAAHETYLELAGTMPWYEVEPGALDHANTDFDVLDEDSIQRSETEDGHLRISGERYATVVLPNCAVLEAETASKLVDFVERGGRLVAVGDVPKSVVGTDGEGDIGALAALFDEGRAHRLASPGDLTGFLAGVPARVEAPVPTLMRRVDDATVLFVPAAFPRATELRMHGGRGVELGWLDIDYEFDPSTYHRHMDVKVEGVWGNPTLWEPYSGEKRPLDFSTDDSGMTVRVPFDDGPGVLVVWEDSDAEGIAEGDADVSGRTAVRSEDVLDDVWTVELEPTLDNRWGDFARPVDGASLPVERWGVRHRAEETADEGLAAGWDRPDLDDSGWSEAHATFGPRGLWTGPATPEDLPAPARRVGEVRESPVEDGSASDGGWRVASYSLSRGIYKDRIHGGTFGPKAHVPEEFLDFGRVAGGEAVQFRTTVSPSEPSSAHFALGAAARKRVWINGAEVPAQDGGYLCVVPVELDEGPNLIEFRLEAEEETELRAYFAFVRDPAGYERPELMRPAGGPVKDSVVSYRKTVSVPFRPDEAAVQVGADTPCRVYVDGTEVGRQGGFDPYFEQHQTRIQSYDLTSRAREGETELRIEVSDLGIPHAVSVDGLFGAGGDSVSVVSDETWEVRRDGEPVPIELRRRPFGAIYHWGDPAWPRLRRRPHPLPDSGWLEDEGPDGVVIRLVPDARAGRSRVEWLRFPVPPGATLMKLAVYGTATVYLDGEEMTPGHESGELEVELPRSEEPQRVCALRVETEPGYESGAILAAPVRFVTGEGAMRLGDWEDRGLAGYSGGVRYKKRIERVGDGGGGARLLLDLGRVRGTAEVLVNGASAGVRIWSPYTFDLTGHLSSGDNDLEVRVFNTAAPYLDAVSPTRFVFDGQRVSGLMGPVRVLEVEG